MNATVRVGDRFETSVGLMRVVKVDGATATLVKLERMIQEWVPYGTVPVVALLDYRRVR